MAGQNGIYRIAVHHLRGSDRIRCRISGGGAEYSSVVRGGRACWVGSGDGNTVELEELPPRPQARARGRLCRVIFGKEPLCAGSAGRMS